MDVGDGVGDGVGVSVGVCVGVGISVDWSGGTSVGIIEVGGMGSDTV